MPALLVPVTKNNDKLHILIIFCFILFTCPRSGHACLIGAVSLHSVSPANQHKYAQFVENFNHINCSVLNIGK